MNCNEAGVREKKAARTKFLIKDIFMRQMCEKQFDAIVVKEIAQEAELAEATVYNYFLVISNDLG